MEHARDVLIKLEKEAKLFLSVAKEPFSKTPPEMKAWHSFFSQAIMMSVTRFHLSFLSFFKLLI